MEVWLYLNLGIYRLCSNFLFFFFFAQRLFKKTTRQSLKWHERSSDKRTNVLALARLPYFATFESIGEEWGGGYDSSRHVSKPTVAELCDEKRNGRLLSTSTRRLKVRFVFILGKYLTHLWEVKGHFFTKSTIFFSILSKIKSISLKDYMHVWQINHKLVLTISRNPNRRKFSHCKGSAKVSDLGPGQWPSKRQDTMPNVIWTSDPNHAVSIPLNGNVSSCWNRYFGEKSSEFVSFMTS